MLSVESRVWAVHGFHALRDPACVFWACPGLNHTSQGSVCETDAQRFSPRVRANLEFPQRPDVLAAAFRVPLFRLRNRLLECPLKNFLIPSLVVASAIASSSSAAIIVFTNEFVWDGYAAGNDAAMFTETFETYNGFYASPLTGSMGGVNWSANATGGIYVGAVGTSQALSTNNPVPMTLSFTGGSAVQGISGNLYATDSSFNVVASIVQLSMQDGTSYIGFIDSATAFVGFYSTTSAITSIQITAQPLAGGPANVYPTFDNMTFAIVPAPGAIALLGLAGFAGRRRR